jgi:hypothetical protein
VQHQIAVEEFERAGPWATGSLPATTITSQRLLKASDGTDFPDGAPTLNWGDCASAAASEGQQHHWHESI